MIIQKHQDVYSNTIEINHCYIIMTRTAINVTTDADNSASFKLKKYQAEKAMMAQKNDNATIEISK